MRNREVASALNELADLMELLEEDRYRVARYRDAAMKIEHLTEPIEQLAADGRVRDVRGVGKSIGGKIEQYLAEGRIDELEASRARVPAAALTLMGIQGIGPRRALLLTRDLGVESLDDLERAIESGAVAKLPRIGERVAQRILDAVQHHRRRSRRLPLDLAMAAAEDVAQAMREVPGVDAVEPAGSLRRMRETIGDIDVVVAAEDAAPVIAAFTALALVERVLSSGDTRASVVTRADLQIDLRVVPPASWGAALQYFTGSKEHNVRLRELAIREGLRLNEYGLFRGREPIAGRDEEELYRALGMAWVPPELREDGGEIEAAIAGTLPRLVETADIRGDLHAHTRLSDGSSTMEEMARTAAERDLEYLAITDHSQALGVARGMTEDELREAHERLAQLQPEFPKLRLLRGVEVDIRADGTLDCSDAFLEGCEVVVASIHSALQRSAEEQTARLIAAMEHPCVDVIGHPTGRIIGKRPGYQIDLGAVLDAAARTGTAIEVSAQPGRLDLDADAVRAAVERGVMLAINTDAHDARQFGLLRYGVGTARRGWAPAEHVLNARSVEGLLAWLRERRAKAAG